jgi:hypothetical protein
MLHIDFQQDPKQIVSVQSMEEAMDVIRQRFPKAIRKVGWDACGNGPEFGWNMAILRVYANSQEMELDTFADRAVLVVNQGHGKPELHARLFFHDVELDV